MGIPPIHKVPFVYIRAVMLLAPMIGFPILKGFTSIEGLANEEGIKPTDGREIKPANPEGKGLADAKETRSADTEESVDAETLADTKDVVVIYYIHQY